MKKIEVVAAVITNEGYIFCAQRKNEGPLAKKWEFPGGKIEKGESRVDALKRELKEELNIEAEIGNYILTVEHQYPTFFLIMHTFYCEVDSKKIILNEHLDSKWLRKDELKQLDWAEADMPIIDEIIS